MDETLSALEAEVLETLIPIFPQHSRQVLLISIRHPSNIRGEARIHNCIDDLLELRTFHQSIISGYVSPVTAPTTESKPQSSGTPLLVGSRKPQGQDNSLYFQSPQSAETSCAYSASSSAAPKRKNSGSLLDYFEVPSPKRSRDVSTGAYGDHTASNSVTSSYKEPSKGSLTAIADNISYWERTPPKGRLTAIANNISYWERTPHPSTSEPRNVLRESGSDHGEVLKSSTYSTANPMNSSANATPLTTWPPECIVGSPVSQASVSSHAEARHAKREGGGIRYQVEDLVYDFLHYDNGARIFEDDEPPNYFGVDLDSYRRKKYMARVHKKVTDFILSDHTKIDQALKWSQEFKKARNYYYAWSQAPRVNNYYCAELEAAIDRLEELCNDFYDSFVSTCYLDNTTEIAEGDQCASEVPTSQNLKGNGENLHGTEYGGAKPKVKPTATVSAPRKEGSDVTKAVNLQDHLERLSYESKKLSEQYKEVSETLRLSQPEHQPSDEKSNKLADENQNITVPRVTVSVSTSVKDKPLPAISSNTTSCASTTFRKITVTSTNTAESSKTLVHNCGDAQVVITRIQPATHNGPIVRAPDHVNSNTEPTFEPIVIAPVGSDVDHLDGNYYPKNLTECVVNYTEPNFTETATTMKNTKSVTKITSKKVDTPKSTEKQNARGKSNAEVGAIVAPKPAKRNPTATVTRPTEAQGQNEEFSKLSRNYPKNPTECVVNYTKPNFTKTATTMKRTKSVTKITSKKVDTPKATEKQNARGKSNAEVGAIVAPKPAKRNPTATVTRPTEAQGQNDDSANADYHLDLTDNPTDPIIIGTPKTPNTGGFAHRAIDLSTPIEQRRGMLEAIDLVTPTATPPLARVEPPEYTINITPELDPTPGVGGARLAPDGMEWESAGKSKTPPTLQIAGAGAKEKSEEEKSMEDLVAMFPKAEPDYIRTLIHQCKCGGSGSHTACVVDSLLTGNYPKRLKCAPPALNTEEKGQVNEIIQAMFPKVPAKALREVLLETKHQLHPAFTMIYQAVKNINHIAFFPLQIWVADTDFRCDIQQPHIVPDIGGNHVEIKVENKKPISVKVLSYGRRRVDTLGLKSLPQSVVQDLQLIVANMETEARVHKAGSISENPTAPQHIDAAVAQDISSGILCGCCYADYPFEQMAQCSDGHLFCTICLQSYAREAVFGHGKSSLNCLDGDCEATFLKRELERCLAKDMFTRYEERCQEEALSLANLTDLVRCPYCDFAAILDPQDKVMSCQNPTCKKETCRYCKEDWEEHIGKSCQEIEKKDETRLRIEFEEKMTQAKIRMCWQCKASIIKLEGCNKMTCRCEAKMCYICREPKIDYNHFCRHVREPGKGCDQCNACSLWTNPEEDDNRAIKEIQEAAKEAHREKGYTERLVGAPDEPKKKKHKGNPKSAVPAQPAVLPLMNVPVVLPLNPPRILQ